MKPRGWKCSHSGKLYETEIYNIIRYLTLDGVKFNTQKIDELAGCSNKNDLECNFKGIKNVGIEVKKSKTPDWMQCSIKYNNEIKRWMGSKKSKINSECRGIFDKLINELNLFDGDVPPFMKKNITHEEWIKIKKNTNKWNDVYIDIPSDTISKLYLAKGCYYIQISNGYGLYHLGSDKCKLDVPLFNVAQQLRVRTKIHTRKNKRGYCNLSVTVACKPKNIKELIPSPFSLDDIDKLPPKLIFNQL